MMRQETKTEVKTRTPAGNGGVPAKYLRATQNFVGQGGGLEATMRELGEAVERINARLRRMREREEEQSAELTRMFARCAEEQRRQGRMLVGE